jgi:hypothetical protein
MRILKSEMMPRSFISGKICFEFSVQCVEGGGRQLGEKGTGVFGSNVYKGVLATSALVSSI